MFSTGVAKGKVSSERILYYRLAIVLLSSLRLSGLSDLRGENSSEILSVLLDWLLS